ncbi:MAG: hypothetical protein ABI647_22440 [Gemmatimonadota bacterium]
MAAALVGLVVGSVHAQVTTEKSSSILVFPKVIADGTRDTIIQITNTSNSMVHAHCFYVNGAPTFADFPPDPITNPPLWIEVDFDIWLTKQQPTHWVVSEGRLVDPTDPGCANGSNNPPAPPNYACNGAGLDPGRVPPVVQYFTGELKCVEVDDSGAPLSGNHLKGEATTIIADVCDPVADACTLSLGACASSDDCDDTLFDVAKYNALGVLGNENNDGDNVLCLGGEPSDECPNGAEYDACPQVWIANHFAQGAPDPFFGSDDDSGIFTSWTFVPCTEDFESQNSNPPTTVNAVINTYNEFETAFSSSVKFTCWAEFDLDQINPVVYNFSVLGTAFAQSRLRPAAQFPSGFLMVGTESHVAPDGNVSTADVNYHVEGSRPGPDLITIPPDQIQ